MFLNHNFLFHNIFNNFHLKQAGIYFIIILIKLYFIQLKISCYQLMTCKIYQINKNKMQFKIDKNIWFKIQL